MKQQKRYEALFNDLRDEQRVWITPDNIDSVITEELFAKPATTGLKTPMSDYWRYRVQSLQLKRLEMLNEEENNYYPEEPMTEELAFKKYKASHKLDVDDMLLAMVGTGADRARYKELVNKFSDALIDLDEDRDEWVEYVLHTQNYLWTENLTFCLQYQDEKEINDNHQIFDYRSEAREADRDEDALIDEYNLSSESDYYDDIEEEGESDAVFDDADAEDDSLEGAVSVIANKDARDVALKAYKARKAAKKVGKKGKR